MDRRVFLGTLPLSAAVNFSAVGGASGVANPAGDKSAWPVVPPGVAYFTREEMERLVDTSVSLQNIPFEVVVYNFPSWHPSPAMETYF